MKIKTNMILTSLLATMILSGAALAASNTYYAKTTMYFNVPVDATFQIALPADYTSFTAITGTNEGAATATNWISFNFTGVPQAVLQEPYQLGVAANTQNSAAKKPIFYIDNTGNCNEKFEIKAAGALPANIAVYFNATGGQTPTATLTALTTGYQTLEANMDNTKFLNVTLFANTSAGIATGTTTQDIYIKSTGS